jgi:transposase
MYWVDAKTGEIVNRRFGRDELIGFLAQRPAGRVALEACGSGHWWARKIKALGHEVVLLHAKFIRPFVQTNKTDAADTWPGCPRSGPAWRSWSVRYRRRCFAVCRTNCNASLGSIDRIEQRIGAWQKQEAACRAIAAVPGIGKLTATALVATIGDAKTFKSGREFASFLGLVPRQSGTGGKIRLGSISKRGDPYLRTLLIHGARSVMCHAKVPTTWQREIRARRPANVAAVALAHKMARTAWAILAHGQAYQKDYVSAKPA